MGFLDALFGSKKPQHPPLDPEAPVGQRLGSFQASLEGFAGKVHDSLEAVPGERTLYVFIGKPPEAFGIVWFNDGREESLRTLMKEKSLPTARVQALSDAVRDVYVRYQSAPRFSSTAAGKAITVTDAAALGSDLDRVLDGVKGG